MSPSRAASVSSTPPSLGGTSRARPPAASTACTYVAGTRTASSSQAPNRARVRYVVTPTTGRALATLEHPLALVARDDLVEEPLLDARVVEVVVDHVVSERGARERPLLEGGRRLAQRRGEPLRARLVRVAVGRRRQLELLLDPVQAGGEQHGEREVRIDVTARDPRLDAQRRSTSHDPEAAGAVVATPRERRRRPRAGRVALVRVDRGREEDRELARARDLAGEVLPDLGRLARERALAAAPQARVDVARVADPGVVGLGHERDRTAVLGRDLLGAVLVDRVVVRHRDRVGVAEVDLLLPRPCLALRGLHGDAGAVHAVPDRAQQRLVVRRGEDEVVEDVRHGGRQVPVVLAVRLLEAVLEEEELELGAEHGV